MARDTEGSLLEIDPNEGVETHEPEGGEPAPKPKKDEETPAMKALRRSNEDLRRSLRDTTEALKTVASRHNAPKEPVVEEPPALSVDLVEAITNNDPKAVAKALREMGVAFQGDIDGKISATRGQMTRDQQLYADFPELQDDKSEFFKVTTRIYHELEQDPTLKGSPRLAELAAKLADRELGGEPQPRRRTPSRSRVEEDVDDLDRELDDEEDDRENDRIERVRRQSGDRGRRSSRVDDRDSRDLDATQKSIVAKLKAAGADISEEGYRKRAEKGVRMAGLPTRRAR